jgi:DNA-directed DNA polymerase III PolC
MGSVAALPRLTTCWSLLRGPRTVEDLLDRAAALGIPALAIADEDALYGAFRFARGALERGIRPVVGADLADDGGGRATLLALDRAGYGALCTLVTLRRLGGAAFRLAEEIPLRAPAGGGLAVICDHPALVPRLAADLPRGTLFVPAGGPRAAALAAAARVPLVAAPRASFLDPARDRRVQRVLRATALGLSLDDVPEGELDGPGAVLGAATGREGAAAAADLAERASFDYSEFAPDRPLLPPPPGGGSAADARERLRVLCLDGVRARYRPLRPAVLRRLARELRVVGDLGFAGYFLLVHEIVRFARSRGIPCAGRGSSADSLVAYALGVSIVDPVAHDLDFERFLHPGRRDCPDVDIDFCWRRRDEVVEHLRGFAGEDRAATLCTYSTMEGKSAFREAARALGLPPREVDRLSARLGHPGRNERPEVREALALADLLATLPRHLSVHPGGMVVADRDLATLVPLERATKGIVVTQYDKRPVEAMGLVKIDLLGNRTLSVLADARAWIRASGREPPDLDGIPGTDDLCARTLAAGDTVGCFQIESPGLRNTLREMDARTRDDATVALSIIRPGPAGCGMKERYLRRRAGLEAVRYAHPSLAPVLAGTLGVMLFQEDVLRAAHAVAGLSMAEADDLRRAMSRARDPAAMDGVRLRFLRGALARGVPPATAGEIWLEMARFTGYAFCKAHACTYGHIAWQAVWMKTRHPAEFLTAVLENEGGFYEAREYAEEARRRGVRILLPCVNRSAAGFTVEDGAIRVGLRRVRSFREGTPEAILAERGRGGSFVSLADLLRRVRLEEAEARNLVACGGCDAFDLPRAELLWRLHLLYGGGPPADRVRRTLFGTEVAGLGPPPRFPVLRHETPEERVEGEMHLLGLTPTAHPLAFFGAELRERNCVPSGRLGEMGGRRVRVGGWKVTGRTVRTKRGEIMRFLTVEDAEGLIECVLFPDAWSRLGDRLRGNGPFVLEGVVARPPAPPVLTVEEAEDLGSALPPYRADHELEVVAPRVRGVDGEVGGEAVDLEDLDPGAGLGRRGAEDVEEVGEP